MPMGDSNNLPNILRRVWCIAVIRYGYTIPVIILTGTRNGGASI